MALITKNDLPHLGYLIALLGWRCWPRPWRLRGCPGLARRLGALWYHLDRADAALTRRNLAALLGPRLTAAGVEATARAIFQHVALHKLLHDLVPELSGPELGRWLTLEGEHHLRQGLAQGRGVILLGAHFGLPGYLQLRLMQHLGYQVTAVLGEDHRPQESWLYRRLVHPLRHRARPHFHMLDPNGLPQREMVDCLRHNRILLIPGDALDQDLWRLPAPYVLPAPLLGRTVPLKTGPFRLARWLKSPLVPFFIIPQAGRFTMVIEPPLPLSPAQGHGGLQADLATFTARFEPYLLRYPALWAHWRHEALLSLLHPIPDPSPASPEIPPTREPGEPEIPPSGGSGGPTPQLPPVPPTGEPREPEIPPPGGLGGPAPCE